MPEKKESFKDVLEEVSKLAERKLSLKLRKHEGPGFKKRLTPEEAAGEIEREFQEEQDKN